MDDVRLGIAVRAMRARRRLRQADLARLARVPRGDVSLLETGRGHEVRLGRVRAVFAALGGWIDVVPRSPAGDLARTLNAGHAAMHEAIAGVLRRAGAWERAHEVSFSIYGERGIIDVLGWHPATRALVVIELKTLIVDANEIVGTMDRRRRLAGRIARDRGWYPGSITTWVVVADTRTNRRRLAEHVELLRTAFPADGRSMGGWLRHPNAAIDALSFLPIAGISGGAQTGRVGKRVRVAPARSAARAQHVNPAQFVRTVPAGGRWQEDRQ